MRARLHATDSRRRKQTQRGRWSKSVILKSTSLSLAALRFGELRRRWMVLIRLNIFSYRKAVLSVSYLSIFNVANL